MTRERFGPPFDRIVGGGKEEKERLEKEFSQTAKHLTEENSTFRTIREHEVKGTREERQIIDAVEKYVDTFIRQYGGDPQAINKDQIAVFDTRALEIAEGTKTFLTAGYFPATKGVFLRRYPSRVAFGIGTAHELFHAKSPHAVQFTKPGTEGFSRPAMYRLGIAVYARDGKKRYFFSLHEAITAEMTQVLYRTKMRNNPLFEEEVRAVDTIKPWIRKWLAAREHGEENESKAAKRLRESLNELYTVPDAERIAEEIRAAGKEENAEEKRLAAISALMAEEEWAGGWTFGLRERHEERQKLNEVLDAICEKSGGEYKTRKEVFDEFARANFTGNILTVGRLIAKTFGKDSLKTIDIEAIKEV